MSVIFGPDISEHQAGIDLARVYRDGYRFVIARCSQGTYPDPEFKGFMRAARNTKLLFGAYMRVGTTSSPAVQAAVVHEQIGDTSVPVFIDTEDHPVDEAKHYQVAQELQNLGYRVASSYLPEWYWDQIGRPKIRVGPLWSSKYVEGTGTAAGLYKRVPRSFWAGYGGQKVKLLQFTDRATVAGRPVDVSAYKGTIGGLRKLFHGTRSARKVAKLTATVTTLKGTPLDLSEIPAGKGPRFAYRNLTVTAGYYPGCVCECIPRWVALVEALAKEAGLPVPLLFWEGSFIVTRNSGTTHAGGGALDIKIDSVPGRRDLTDDQITTLTRICRRAGGMAYYRGPGTRYGNFSTRHLHVELIGCEHASQGARDQWAAYKTGRDALAINGPDYGPYVDYITADQAFNKLTTTATGDWFEMATLNDLEKVLAKYLGDRIPSPALDPAAVKRNPFWTWASTLSIQTKTLLQILGELRRLSKVFTRDAVPSASLDPDEVKKNPNWFYSSHVTEAGRSARRQEQKLDQIIDLLERLASNTTPPPPVTLEVAKIAEPAASKPAAKKTAVKKTTTAKKA